MAPEAGEWGWMAAVAAEELEKLEAAHPGRLGPLKDELKRLVADPGWDDADAFALASLEPNPSPSSSQPAAPLDLFTEESSTNKRKWCDGGGAAIPEQGKRRRKSAPPVLVKDRADMAIDRAKKCLKKIRAIKRSLLGGFVRE
ncbi:hypothetical protein ACQ4PT_000850 [Festuca glaucescens]